MRPKGGEARHIRRHRCLLAHTRRPTRPLRPGGFRSPTSDAAVARTAKSGVCRASRIRRSASGVPSRASAVSAGALHAHVVDHRPVPAPRPRRDRRASSPGSTRGPLAPTSRGRDPNWRSPEESSQRPSARPPSSRPPAPPATATQRESSIASNARRSPMAPRALAASSARFAGVELSARSAMSAGTARSPPSAPSARTASARTRTSTSPRWTTARASVHDARVLERGESSQPGGGRVDTGRRRERHQRRAPHGHHPSAAGQWRRATTVETG